CQQYYSLTF
nr:immunoglobulin light chain junction region [Homo sapiens]